MDGATNATAETTPGVEVRIRHIPAVSLSPRRRGCWERTIRRLLVFDQADALALEDDEPTEPASDRRV